MKKILVAATALALCAGCVYKGAKITEGTDFTIGMELPGSDGVAQLNVMNYLSGFRLGVAKNARMTVTYSTVETNSWFGVMTSGVRKEINATVEPCEDDEVSK